MFEMPALRSLRSMRVAQLRFSGSMVKAGLAKHCTTGLPSRVLGESAVEKDSPSCTASHVGPITSEGAIVKVPPEVLPPRIAELPFSTQLVRATFVEVQPHHGVIPSGCVVHRVADSERLRRLLTQADPGEAEAICLAVETDADLLLIDDKKGRRLAEAEGVRCLGWPALVLAAWQRQLIPSIAGFLDLMEHQSNYCLSARPGPAGPTLWT